MTGTVITRSTSAPRISHTEWDWLRVWAPAVDAPTIVASRAHCSCCGSPRLFTRSGLGSVGRGPVMLSIPSAAALAYVVGDQHIRAPAQKRLVAAAQMSDRIAAKVGQDSIASRPEVEGNRFLVLDHVENVDGVRVRDGSRDAAIGQAASHLEQRFSQMNLGGEIEFLVGDLAGVRRLPP